MQGADAREAALERLLEEALAATLLLERAPKALIEVHAFVAQCGGGEAAAAVMAAGLAAANAQLDLRCLPSAACVVRVFAEYPMSCSYARCCLFFKPLRAACVNQCLLEKWPGALCARAAARRPALQVTRGAHLLADPSPAEVAAADRAATAVMHSPRARVAHLTVSGIFSAAELADVIEVASDACAFYDEQLRGVLLAAAAGAPG